MIWNPTFHQWPNPIFGSNTPSEIYLEFQFLNTLYIFYWSLYPQKMYALETNLLSILSNDFQEEYDLTLNSGEAS